MRMSKNSVFEKIYIFLPSFLITLASLIYTYTLAWVVSSPAHLPRFLAVLWLLLLILAWPAYILTRDWHLTGILLSIFVLGFYLKKDFFYAIVMMSGLGFGAWLLLFYILKKKNKMAQVTHLSNLIAATVLASIVAYSIPVFQQVKWTDYQDKLSDTKQSLPVAASLPEKKPDIYYIILDAYARSDILQQYYQYDNSGFNTYLTEKGFIIPQKIHSNYPMTTLSLTSTLNMDYIPNIVSGTEESSFWWLMEPYVDESRAQLFLNSLGYQTISIATSWDVTNNTSTDIHYKPHPIHLDGFEGFFLAETPLSIFTPLLENIATLSTHNSHRELVLYNFEALADISMLPGPKFVFAHIVSPHPPFVLDKNGDALTPSYNYSIADGNNFPGTDDEYRAKYIEQVQFMNTALQKTIDIILAQSKTPPIIMLQADHGPRMLNDPQYPQNICPMETFSIFAAYYLPGLENNPIPSEFTPVNTFRIIFNEYFSTQLPLLENVSYAPNDDLRIYRTHSIQSRLNLECSP